MFCNSSKVKRHILSIHKAESLHDTNDENKSLTPLSNESNEIIKKQCHYCEKTLLGNNLWRHKHSLCDVTFPCERCGKVFNYEASLNRHIKTCQ